MAYLSMFPIGSTMRANLFVYRDLHDPRLTQFRDAPRRDTSSASSLGWTRQIGGPFEVDSFVKIRPVDLYVSENYRQPGIVLVGDAFATSCPAAGTGTNKVFTDVERLCNVYIPQWLATSAMGPEKTAAFYDDPVKQACDAYSSKKAYSLRSLSIDTGLFWTAQRLARFVLQSVRGALWRLGAPRANKVAFSDDGSQDGIFDPSPAALPRSPVSE